MADLLSSILSFARTTSSAGGGLVAASPWAIAFPKLGKIKSYGILRGRCWLKIEKSKDPILIETGDVVLLSGLRSYVLSSSLNVKPLSAKSVFPTERRTFAQIRNSSESDFEFVGGHTTLDALSAQLLQASLPAVVHLKSTNPQAKLLISLLRQLAAEFQGELPGAEAICNQLSHLIFIQGLRAALESPAALRPGWLRSLAESRIAPAVAAIHSDPGKNWTIASLAKTASMSRSSFMQIFKQETSLAPLQYITKWRMILAQQLLKNGANNISEVAFSLGYASESSFSHAFKRVIGKSPRSYRGDQ